jgi:hypothetical protein
VAPCAPAAPADPPGCAAGAAACAAGAAALGAGAAGAFFESAFSIKKLKSAKTTDARKNLVRMTLRSPSIFILKNSSILFPGY